MGSAYDDGNGVAKDYFEAAKWLHRAARQGHADAQFSVGGLYFSGQGVVQDYVEAHMWYNLASAQKWPLAPAARSLRESLAELMTPAQLAEAQERARNFQPVIEESASAGPSFLKAVRTGTGFFVSSQGHILTNMHVVNACPAVRVRLPGSNPVYAEILLTNPDVDLAVITVDPAVAQQVMGWGGQHARFRSGGAPRPGDSVVAYGFPLTGALASEGNVTIGYITALAGPKDDSRLYQISAPVQPGNSGGPLFDEGGCVIGVVAAKLDAVKIAAVTGDIPQNVNFALKSEIGTSFLGLYQIPYTAEKRSRKRLAPADVAEDAQRVTVQVECLQYEH